jgi:hypothetical protein
MGRIRSMKPELLDDEEASALPDAAWRVWLSTWLLADDHGNLRAGTRYLAANIFQDTGREADVVAALERLCRPKRPGGTPFLQLYEVGGQVYAHVTGFGAHQKITHPCAAKIPGPDQGRYVAPPNTRQRGQALSKIPRTSTPSLENPPKTSEIFLSHARALDGDQDQERDQEEDQDRERDQEGERGREVDTGAVCSSPHTAEGSRTKDPWGLTPGGSDPDVLPHAEAAPSPEANHAGPAIPGTNPHADPDPDPPQPVAAPQRPAGAPPAPASAATPDRGQDGPAPLPQKAHPSGGKARRSKPATPPPLPTVTDLTPVERATVGAIKADETLSRICRNVEMLARDLVRVAPLVDVVQEIRSLGAYTRTPKGLAKRYTDGNALLLGCIRRKQEEQAERQAQMGQFAQPARQAPRQPAPPPLPRDVQEQLERDGAETPPTGLPLPMNWRSARPPVVTPEELTAEGLHG